MLKKGTMLVACGAFALGCAEHASETRAPEEAREVVANLRRAGFPADDITVVEGVVYVGRDAAVSLAASREMLQAGGSSEEQYRTNNTVNTLLRKICIDGPTFTGVFSTALDLAIQNYDERPLSFAMARAQRRLRLYHPSLRRARVAGRRERHGRVPLGRGALPDDPHQ
ncbi:MAG TPA: M57 family metalloprotease [Polyangiaceae bacterium]|nr:M57 family metalloprotease [Polyangiaceae bacterium]